jgi:hypothetical protein
MLTWKLWRALHEPPTHHPLFAHISKVKPSRLGHLLLFTFPMGIVILAAILGLGVLRTPQVITTPIFNTYSAGVVAFLVFTGTLYGMVWSANISRILVRLRTDGKYDLLRLSTASELHLNWAVCTGYLHRNRSFSRVHGQKARLAQYILMVPGALAMPLMIGIASENEAYTMMLMTTVVHTVVLAGAYYIDYAQSVIIGGLIGMIVPLYSRSEIDSRMVAGFSFLALQISSYAITWWLGFVALPSLYTHLNIGSGYPGLSLHLLQLLIFYACREAIISGLWNTLQRQLPAGDIALV